MLNDKTDGGLIIYPKMRFQDLDEDDMWIHDYKDGMFDHPFSLELLTIDPKEFTSTTDQNYKFDFTSNLKDNMMYLSGQQDTKMDAELGFASYEGMDISVAGTELTYDKVNKLFTNLAIKAGDNIASGQVNEKDLTDLIHRDAGVHDGSKYEAFRPPGAYLRRPMGAKRMKEGLATTVIEQLKLMSAEKGQLNPDDTPKTLKEYAKTFMDRTDDSTDSMSVKGQSIMSGIIHGIGAKNFMTAFFDEFSKLGSKEKETVDELFSDDRVDDKLTNRLVRSLPIGSSYHERAVRNHYNNKCK